MAKRVGRSNRAGHHRPKTLVWRPPAGGGKAGPTTKAVPEAKRIANDPPARDCEYCGLRTNALAIAGHLLVCRKAPRRPWPLPTKPEPKEHVRPLPKASNSRKRMERPKANPLTRRREPTPPPPMPPMPKPRVVRCTGCGKRATLGDSLCHSCRPGAV